MKSRSNFRFRQFSVADDRCSMKVGTDAVLLAAWANLKNASRVLDIGTGSGVIALIAAQRTTDHCHIDGVEILDADYEQAVSNVAASPWPDRVSILHADIQNFYPASSYDSILCNPPYFINSLRPPAHGRTTARHTVTLDHATLIAAIGRLLSPEGTANIILPPAEGQLFIESMASSGMQIVRLCQFKTRQGNKAERLLMTFARTHDHFNSVASVQDFVPGIEQEELLLYADGDSWTKQYRELTQDLYLPRP